MISFFSFFTSIFDIQQYVTLKMTRAFKIQNKQLYEWIYEDKTGSSLKKSDLVNKIQQMFDYNCFELEQISKKLNRVFFPHIKRKMKVCHYNKKQFEMTSQKFLNNYFVVKLVD